MKKFIIILILSIIIPLTSFASFDTSLKYGSRGEPVIELQDFLQDLGYLNDKIDGRYGLKTRKAVIDFQINNNLKGDGYFGIKSRAKANEILNNILAPSLEAEKTETGTITPINTNNNCENNDIYNKITGKLCNPSIINNTALQNNTIEQIDTQKPIVNLYKMLKAWNENHTVIQNDNKLSGVMGLWTYNIYEEPLPSSGIQKIEYYIDGKLLDTATNIDNKIILKTKDYENGDHELSVKIYDKAGNIGTDSIKITIKN